MTVLVGGAYSAGHRAVFGHGVAYTESYHAVVALAVALTHKLLCYHLERVAAIEIVGIDYGERLFDGVLAHEYGVVRTPGFAAVGRTGISFGQVVD